jgi:hypothetical protein
MRPIELKPREFHRRTAWALASARKGMPIIIVSRAGPALTLRVGRPEDNARTEIDWDQHFAWLKQQPLQQTNPVDELRTEENR